MRMFLPRLCIPPPAFSALAAAALFAATAPGSHGTGWRPSGPFGGPVEVVAADPQSPGRFLAGSPDGLLSITTDGGDHWRPVRFPGEMASALHAIYFDQGRVYAAVSPDSPGGPGLYRSDDVGETWRPQPHFRGNPVWAITGSPSEEGVLAAGAGDGVYLSRDHGETWRRISPESNAELSPVVSLAFDPNDSAILYAGTTHLPWKTSDGGKSWRSIHKGLLDDSDVFSIHVDPAQPASVLLSACSGIYRSADAGANWTKMRGSADASYRTYVMTRDPGNPSRLLAGTSHGLLRSTDGGRTWATVLAGAAKSVIFDPADPTRIFAATTDRGLFRSADSGVTFQPVDSGRVSRHFHSLVASGGRIYAGGYDRVTPLFSSIDGGDHWNAAVARVPAVRAPAPLPSKRARTRRGKSRGKAAARKAAARPAPDTSLQAGFLFAAAAPDQPDLVYAATTSALRRSADGGRTWTTVRGPGSGGMVTALLVRRGITPVPAPPIPAASTAKQPRSTKRSSKRGRRARSRKPAPPAAVKPAPPAAPGLEIWLATTAGLYRGNAEGTVWHKIASGGGSGLGVSGIRRIVEDGGRLFVLGRDGAAWSMDEGTTWSALRAPVEGAEWNGVAAFESVILAATSHGLFRSVDDGMEWTPVAGPINSDSVSTVLFHRLRPGVAFAAQFGSIFVSHDAGRTWTVLGGELSTNSIHTLTLLPERPDRVYALVAGRGIYYAHWETSK
ncbi:MAG: hypothetical protein R2762_21650 [Bryobacteraceae bacterium]